MSDMRTEEEQVEALKKWWDENGKSLVASVVIVAAGWFGWDSYQSNQQATAEAASQVYSQLVEQAALPAAEQTDGTRADMQQLAERLVNDFDGTAYAQFGNLFIARLASDGGDFDSAAAALKNVVETADNGPIKYTAQARLALVLTELERFDEALASIATVPDPAYQVQFEEARGDIYWRQGNTADALAAYQKALQAAQDNGAGAQLLQRKIDHLASTGEV
ncbi:hypothetical protein CHH28_11310 [Bacterioplanes sanyensis]|uniref:Ancillary SecYEG translocon subunit n=1 Tax=Bacterioplanes sanyensis TaxID=1249553 RepID=A0A222FJP8_9GAMM|nr:tetratricopeptide repeat protein [Bacterioplanes sanyensis]ASP39228.1 hypothetical protein CHH28_11310 [Bacterioplanes sanyensis]